MKKAVKLSITATSITVGVGLINYGLGAYEQNKYAQKSLNKTLIISEASKSPMEWSDLVINYQNENDFYAEVLSQRGLETIVEIDKVMEQSL